MHRSFFKDEEPDGEIAFLAADPDYQGKGIGSALLKALEKDEKGKLVYLYTDNACSYGFYEHRGFLKAEQTPDRPRPREEASAPHLSPIR